MPAVKPSIPKKSFDELASERPSQRSRSARKRAKLDYGLAGSGALQRSPRSLADASSHDNAEGRSGKRKKSGNANGANDDDENDDDDDDDDNLVIIPHVVPAIDDDPVLLESKERLRFV